MTMNLKLNLNRNHAILILISIMAIFLIYTKYSKEAFKDNYSFEKINLKGPRGFQGDDGPSGNKGAPGVIGPACKNIISQLETRGFLNMGGTYKEDGETLNSQLTLKGQVVNKGANSNFYKLKITDYDDSYPIMVGNNENDYNFYLHKDTTNNKFTMALKGELKLTGNLTFSNNQYVDRRLNTQNIFYNLAPKGIIAAFYSNNDKLIPTLWTICNGQTIEGFKTPDLRGKFIMGGEASGVYENNDDAFDGEHKFKDGKMKLTNKHMPVHNHDLDKANKHTHKVNVKEGGDHSHKLTMGGSPYSGKMAGSYARQSTGSDGGSFYTGREGKHNHEMSMDDSGEHKHKVHKTGKGEAIDIMPPYFTMVFIIKYK